jgi:hypothetical protein
MGEDARTQLQAKRERKYAKRKPTDD